MDRLIGIDVGTTALKAVLIDAAGNRLAAYAEPYPIARPAPGHAEQEPGDWMAAIANALAAFARDHDLSAVAGIGICSQVNTHVFAGADGVPLLPAILWQDQRAAPEAADLDARITADQKLGWFGAPIPIDASHALARMEYVRRHRPEVWAGTRHVLLPKDYCVLQLTGAVGSDPVSAVGLVGQRGYVGELLDLVPGAAERLPSLHPMSHVAGRVRDGLPCAGVPVVVGTLDAWGGMFGVGVVADGDAMYQSGTSEIAGIVSARVTPTPGVIVFPPYEGIVLHAAPTQTGGAALAWASRLFERNPAAFCELAGTVPPSDAIPLFLPHLEGERAPYWDSSTRGVFARIDTRAGAPEMARSVLEGVALSVAVAFGALETSAGLKLTSANIGGGGARSDLWCQIRADALGFALRRAAVPEAAALGAAILAGLGSGLMTSLADAVRRLVTFNRVFEPDPALRGYYRDKRGKFEELYRALRPFNSGYAAPG